METSNDGQNNSNVTQLMEKLKGTDSIQKYKKDCTQLNKKV